MVRTFNDAILKAQGESARKRERGLAEHLRVHGIPPRHDLGALLAVKRMFPVSGDAWERIMARAKRDEARKFRARRK